MKVLAWRIPDEAAMRTLGGRLAAELAEPDVVALYGPLGAGKTVLVQGVAAALGYTGPVRSPSFTLMRVYECPHVTLYHFDAYRLRSLAEWDALGTEEIVANQGISLIEWAERVEPGLPSNRWEIHIQGVGEAMPRQVELVAPRAAALARLAADPQLDGWRMESTNRRQATRRQSDA